MAGTTSQALFPHLDEIIIVKTVAGFKKVMGALIKADALHGLDFETTSLKPSEGRVRISSISGPVAHAMGARTIVVDHFAHPEMAFERVAPVMATMPWYVFNISFEGRWFKHANHGIAPITLLDVGYMSKARLGGRPLSLKQMCQRDLEIELSKEQQMSDWSAPELTDEQYVYAGYDAEVTFDLGVYWLAILKEHNLMDGFYVFNDAWEGTAAMEDEGMLIDAEHHSKLIRMWHLRRDVAEAVLRKHTPVGVIANLRSKKQLSDFLKTVYSKEVIDALPKTPKQGVLSLTRKDLRQLSYRSPYPLSRWLAALMVFNRADKYLGTYGEKLLNIQEMKGAVYARFNIAQAITGRYSSSEPNVQNIPRSPLVRRSFITKPGYAMVLADYSGIELRVLAELTDDEQLRQDVIYGDVHSENAVLIFGHDRDRFMAAIKAKDPRAKEQRARSKSFSFQLTYGAGTAACALALRVSDDAAARHIEAWSQRYPRAFQLRQHGYEAMRIDGFLRTKLRTIYVPRQDRTVPVAANYPVQGTAAEVMYQAVTRQYEWCEDVAPAVATRAGVEAEGAAKMLASIHDELLSLARWGIEQEALEAQTVNMKAAWLDVFPGTSTENLLETAIGEAWSAKP